MSTQATTALITPEALLQTWQGHRRLTRRVIEAFPDDQLFTFSIRGMRPFGLMALEMISMAVPVVEGVATGHWAPFGDGNPAHRKPTTKSDLLALWDQQTTLLDQKFPQIPPARFFAVEKAFDAWEMPGIVTIQYAVDNERPAGALAVARFSPSS